MSCALSTFEEPFLPDVVLFCVSSSDGCHVQCAVPSALDDSEWYEEPILKLSLDLIAASNACHWLGRQKIVNVRQRDCKPCRCHGGMNASEKAQNRYAGGPKGDHIGTCSKRSMMKIVHPGSGYLYTFIAEYDDNSATPLR